jgi:hypothetical protein
MRARRMKPMAERDMSFLLRNYDIGGTPDRPGPIYPTMTLQYDALEITARRYATLAPQPVQRLLTSVITTTETLAHD